MRGRNVPVQSRPCLRWLDLLREITSGDPLTGIHQVPIAANSKLGSELLVEDSRSQSQLSGAQVEGPVSTVRANDFHRDTPSRESSLTNV